MFDDLFCATALIGILSVAAAVVASIASPPEHVSAASTQVVTVGQSTAKAVRSGPLPSAAAMPIYDLPRVVITRRRVPDGDMLADSSTPGRKGPAELPDR